jgi:hypothetical protein
VVVVVVVVVVAAVVATRTGNAIKGWQLHFLQTWGS